MNNKPIDLLLVDDEETLIKAFEKIARRSQMEFEVARDGLEALRVLGERKIDVALLDLNSKGMSGLQVLEYVKKNQISTEAILITGRATIETAIASLKMGAYDYLMKPFEDIDSVVTLIKKAQEKAQLVRRIRELEEKHASSVTALNGLLGCSTRMLEVYSLIENVAPSESSILIVGESGTGKELVAHAIHQRGLRSRKPFIIVNCSALPETLMESELFGHAKGSFTGAIQDRKGLFAEAHGGTIFLDEIGEIPQSVQVKLLRVLQDGEIRPVGGAEPFHVDVRIISATNRDLYGMVRKGDFREDLFYRLNVITVRLPALRERKEDIPLLCYHFMKKYASKSAKKLGEISLDTLQALQEYAWPGNVRELENIIERAVVLSQNDRLTARDLPPKILGEVFYKQGEVSEEEIGRLTYQDAKDRTLELFNRSYVSHLLQMTDGNVSLASTKAGMDRSNFKKIIKKCSINVREFRKRKEN
ncbi:MAG: sigma-54-dependent Fis family transcriptional regulator [Deltaproteobacteria bacterium]|nr:sigma-54-dependent Fis family transcriptional regulator [Deltaproteobacteria bacterium]